MNKKALLIAWIAGMYTGAGLDESYWSALPLAWKYSKIRMFLKWYESNKQRFEEVKSVGMIGIDQPFDIELIRAHARNHRVILVGANVPIMRGCPFDEPLLISRLHEPQFNLDPIILRKEAETPWYNQFEKGKRIKRKY